MKWWRKPQKRLDVTLDVSEATIGELYKAIVEKPINVTWDASGTASGMYQAPECYDCDGLGWIFKSASMDFIEGLYFSDVESDEDLSIQIQLNWVPTYNLGYESICFICLWCDGTGVEND